MLQLINNLILQKMTKKEVIKLVSKKSGETQDVTEKVLESFYDLFAEKMEEKEEFPFGKFGKFKVTTRKSYSGRNPATGESIIIPETNKITFSQFSFSKELIN